jgi:hypothetical protein
LFTGRQVTAPPVFEGLTPGMPLLAARVLFPQLPDDDYVAASVPNLKFRILARYGWVDTLTIDVQQPGAHPNLNDLAEMATEQWGRAEGASQPHWFGPDLRARIVGSMMLFEPWRTAEAFIRDDVPRLRGLLDQPSSRIKEVFEGARAQDDGFETYLVPLKWTNMIRVGIHVRAGRVAHIELTLEHSDDTPALIGALGQPEQLKNLRRFTLRSKSPKEPPVSRKK